VALMSRTVDDRNSAVLGCTHQSNVAKFAEAALLQFVADEHVLDGLAAEKVRNHHTSAKRRKRSRSG